MGDVRTERGDLVPEMWEYMWGFGNEQIVSIPGFRINSLISDLAAATARADELKGENDRYCTGLAQAWLACSRAEARVEGLETECGFARARAEQAEAENKRLKEALDVIPAALEWEYRGEGLYITFLNPWKDWKRQDLLCFMWPIHPPEVTGAVETYYETIAEAICRLRSLAGQEKKEGGQNE